MQKIKTIIISEGNSIIKDGALKNFCYEQLISDEKNKDYDLHVIIPSGITEIGWYAFWGCSNLVSVLIGKDIRGITCAAFSHCGNSGRMVPNKRA
jgi:hypothetical protein